MKWLGSHFGSRFQLEAVALDVAELDFGVCSGQWVHAALAVNLCRSRL
jgi:hypothetical protein